VAAFGIGGRLGGQRVDRWSLSGALAAPQTVVHHVRAAIELALRPVTPEVAGSSPVGLPPSTCVPENGLPNLSARVMWPPSNGCRDVRRGNEERELAFAHSRRYAIVAGYRGALRAFVACSNANAYFSSAGSLHAPAKNEMPTGSPCTSPAGTVMCGYPETADALE